ncbi:Cj0069 family protein [Deinococcus sp. KSM4-11]|uniref:Cj0069 family protein n=1 Tax=Deinococcus sp. KSM4-11 TaxID=2568654 RepID=UPI0010A4B069|nr:Cj0069 family protein [Deinococcus sp. KSM4-11]THF85433.1 Cj0069 family protein [Deinococcus sp. KSM4-11]
MMTPTIGMMISGQDDLARSVFTDEKYRALAEALGADGLRVESIVYNNARAEALRAPLQHLDALLVWVNPLENGEDRRVLDALLLEVSRAGVMVSTHPDTIQRIGTKRVLYETREMDWGSDVELYPDFSDFVTRFADSFAGSHSRVLKRFRGDGGNGIYKVSQVPGEDGLSVLHAHRGAEVEHLSAEAFYARFENLFAQGQPLINQAWNANITNGMVRCYLCGDRVAGFGYQEIIALYPSGAVPVMPSRRHYYSAQCGLFSDLKRLMEERWVGQLMQRCGVEADALPVLWDADFFIDDPYSRYPDKYTLCEINVSCVSPFPDSAIPEIGREVRRRVSGI